MARIDVKYVFLTHLVPAIPNTQEAKDEFMDGMKQFYNGNLQIADDRDELVISSANSSKQCLVKYVPNKNDGYKIYKNSHGSLRCVENC
ncbi:hypothetical protein [Candidiatus Paracoxiella cheracis]|uniref:hypothetical protein n=1 Tax=Candidiatus Paracoxiella cheracis TaxID=3405120 RepID=UPI003BF53E86